MAGANGILKKAIWNREDQFQNLQYTGVLYNQVDLNLTGTNPPIINPTFALAAMTAAEFITDWVFTANGTNAYTAPLNTDLNTLFAKNTVYVAGNQITMSIVNTDPLNPKTITFPAGYTVTPNPLIVPPNSNGHITLMYDPSTVGASCLFTVTDFYFGRNGGTTGPTLPPGLLAGDMLEWNGTAWVPSSSVQTGNPPGIIPSLINYIAPFPSPSANPFQKLWVFSGMNINYFDNAGVRNGLIRLLVGAGDDIVGVATPPFTANNQATVRAETQAATPITASGFTLDSHFTSTFGVTNGVPIVGTPTDVWHFLGINPGPAVIASPVGIDAAGQAFASSFNVVSDAKLKKNVKQTKMDSRALRDYKVSLYHMLGQADDAPLNLGLIADDVAQLLPAAFGKPKDEKSAAHLSLVPLLAALLGYAQDLEARLSALEPLLAKNPLKTASVV